jgi:hypothetical protein
VRPADSGRLVTASAAVAHTPSRPDDHTLAFVGGLHRSGTTLLARCLAAHPSASGFADTGATEDEGQHLQSVYPVRLGGPGRFGFSAAAHVTESSPLITAANRERLWAEWSRHWDHERRVLIEKSPANLLKSRFLQAMFPRARFIMVLRHPIATALATQKWSGTRLDELIRHWLICNETMVADAPRLRHVTLVRYEDLVAEGDGELLRLHRFLGIDPRPYGLEPRPGLNDAYRERWDALGRGVVRPLYRRAIVRRFEARVGRFGYSLRDPELLAPREALLARLLSGRP